MTMMKYLLSYMFLLVFMSPPSIIAGNITKSLNIGTNVNDIAKDIVKTGANYEMTDYGKLCSPDLDQYTIQTEAQCRNAASQLGRRFIRTVNSDRRTPGCYAMPPGWVMYFNTSPNPATTASRLTKSICSKGGCQQRRVRKNVNSLTSIEVNNLQNAMKRALESSIPWRKYQDVAHFHWSPNTGSDALCGEGVGCCPHNDRKFLPWHRLLMVNMEELLGEPLPYWDWTLDSDVPNIFDNIQVPFKRTLSVGRQCQGTNTGSIRRGNNINIPSSDLLNGVQTAFDAVDFETFSSHIELPHNTLHVRMRCDFFAVQTAAYDPIFYLHHANVDRQFAFWQELQRIRNRDIEHSDLSIPLKPFNNETINPFEKTRNNNLGVNTLDYKTNLCYDYDTLTFNGMTPQQFNTKSARRIFRYFVGIVLPKLGPSTAVKFSVCSRRGRCKAAGRVFTFGLGGKKGRESKKTVNSKNYYIAEKEVTHLGMNWKSAYARVRSSPDISPVAPVIIKRTIQDHLSGGVVFYAPGTNTTMYGDLLEKFTDSA